MVKNRKLSITMISVALALSFTTSCVGPSTPTTVANQPPSASTQAPASTPQPAAATPSPKAAPEQPRYGGMLTAAATADPPDLDIHRQSGAVTFAVVGPCYNGLLQYDPQQNDILVPDLAEKWDMSADGKVYTFYLHKGAKTHDDKLFTSEDVKYSLQRMGEFAQIGSYVPFIDRVETPDNETVRVVLERPVVGWASLAGHGRVLLAPKHAVDIKGDLKWTVIGTGPYKFQDYSPGVQVRLVKNKDYFIPGRPYLDGITFYVIKDTATQMAAFRTRRVQFFGPPTYGLTPSQAEILKKDLAGKAVIAPFYRLAFFGLVPNPLKKPWDDVRVRRAAFLATDREKGMAVVAEGFGEYGVTWAPGEWALPKEELMRMPGFRKPKDQDIVEAKRLMAEAGYASGIKTSVVARAGYTDYEKIATFFREQLAQIGIDLEIRMTEYSAMNRMRLDRSLDSMAVLSHFCVADPNITYRYVTFKYGQMSSFLDDPKMIELLDRQSAMFDKEQRKKIMYELQYTAAEVVPHIHVGWMNSYLGYWPEMRDYKSGFGLNNNLKMQDVWLAR